MLRILETREIGKLLDRRSARMADAESVVTPILLDVKRRGDAAVRDYAKRFDQIDRKSLLVSKKELDSAIARVSPQFRKAVKLAARNVREFAKLQLPKPTSKRLQDGLVAGQIIRPLDSAACYVPGGRYPLPSTLLMTVILAQTAGVPVVSATTPKAADEVLAAAGLLNVDRMFLMGGAHAIAAFAYGTKTVPKADRIVGPGNIYVAAAKKLLAGEVGIDFLAGPTEILIIASEGDPSWLAADMLAQAEHDTDASAILLTTSKSLAVAVQREVESQLQSLPTAKTARVAIDKNSAIILVQNLEQAAEISNRFAPEHLSLYDKAVLPLIKHAGGIFIGASSPEAAGDYAAGPSHVLPTNGAARIRGGLSSADFVKVIATQQLSPKAIQTLTPTVATLARAEGLEAHARSAEIRLKKKGSR
jgi:histidinol dehydrogenase